MPHEIHVHTYDRYVDGTKIMIGDRVSWLSNDINNPHIGVIVAVLSPKSKEARTWCMPDGGYLVYMDDLGLTGAAQADEEMSLIARGSEAEISWAKEFMRAPSERQNERTSQAHIEGADPLA